jgi:uncharacterized protein YkwD
MTGSPRRVWGQLVCTAALLACSKQAKVERPHVSIPAPGEGAASYQSEASAEAALRGSHGDLVGRSLEQAATHAKRPVPAQDGRLGQLAEWVAARLGPDEMPPPMPAIELWTRHLGIPEPTPVVVVRLLQNDATLEARMAQELEPFLTRRAFTHVGASAALRDDGGVISVTVLSARALTMQAVPRVVSPGDIVVLRGRLAEPLHDPKLVLTEPNGSTKRVDARKGREFNAEVRVGRGELRVELLAESEVGTTVVANFPVYAGVAPATSVSVPVPLDTPLDERAVVDRLLELVNADRARARLAPLQLDDELSLIALAHSRDMHDNNFIGHTSKTTGSASDRLQRAGVRTDLVLENVGRDYGPEEVHRALMESPGHRANVVHPTATHIGIGVVREVDEGRSAYLVTELFTRKALEIDVDDAPDELLDIINAERVRRGVSPLRADSALAELADATARGYFAPAPLANDELVAALSRKAAAQSASRYKGTAALLTVVSALPDARGITALLDPKVRAVGFGVAQGTRRDSMPHAIVVVAVLGF